MQKFQNKEQTKDLQTGSWKHQTFQNAHNVTNLRDLMLYVMHVVTMMVKKRSQQKLMQRTNFIN